MNSHRARAFGCACVIATFATQPAISSTDEPAVAAGSLEVMVTARKRTERLRDVPLEVAVLDTQALNSGGVHGLRDVAARVPGLSFEPGILLPIAIMRGQWQPSIAGDNVGIFIDGVYQANRAAADAELLDLARVEVLQGPQSALFGHSTFAGAINYVSQSPGDHISTGAALESGSDRWRAAQAWWSGPVFAGWNARLALGVRAADGGWSNSADQTPLGSFKNQSLALTLQRAIGAGMRWQVALRARFGSNSNSLPPTYTIDGLAYNCGSRDRNSGQWSYFCGSAPIRAQFDLSPGVPDGSSHAAQFSLQQSWRLGALLLQSDSSFYQASADVVRDLDVSSTGQMFGVCTIGSNCAATNTLGRTVNRLVRINAIQHQRPGSQEWLQELRLSSASDARFTWMLGIAAFSTREVNYQSLGVTRGDLAASEQLTALLPATPQSVGPISQFNRALVADPATTQVDQANALGQRDTTAAFGAASLALGAHWKIDAELRITHERTQLDSRTANFLPSFGTALGARQFRDATPRISISFQPGSALRGYASLAKGSRSGGINSVPGLPAGEQAFRPEFNWTWETGLRLQSSGMLRGLQATAYYIDWRDTQILGFSTTPQITNLITRNTAGITTRGLEFSAQLQLASWLRLEGSASWMDARFRAGSDEPGALAFCGLGNGNSTSTFCTVGTPRSSAAGSLSLVPWIDGNFVGRTPRSSVHAALFLEPAALGNDWRTTWRLDVDRQGQKFERAIEGLRFGERLLLDARWTLQRAPWSLELWGRNLRDERYILTMAGPQPQFYPTLPRPQHVVLAEGRRIGLTLRYQR